MAIVINKRPSKITWTGNPCNYELYSAAADADATIYFEVRLMYKYVSGSYTEAVRFPVFPKDGLAQVDVKDLIHGILNHGLPPFTGTETDVYIAPEQTGFFYLSFREVTGSATLFDNSEVDYERLAVKGGLSYQKWRGNAFWDDYADVTAPSTFPFFTWQKSGRSAGLTERMYLAWLNYTDVAAADLVARVTVYYTDGTNSADGDKDIALTGAVKNKIIYIPTGAEQLALDAIDITKTIYYWVVRVYDISGGSPVAYSGNYTYYADYRQDYNNTVLHYRNSLGGLDSVMIRGVIEQNLDYSNELVTVVTGYNYYDGSSIAAQQRMIESRERLLYKGDIGFTDKDEQDRLRDAHLQREVWWCVSLKWWPVINATGNFRKTTSADMLWNMPFEWMLGTPPDKYYTPSDAATGNASVNTNVCSGTVSGVTVTKTLNVSDADIEFDATVTGATQFTYQVLGFHASPVTANAADLPVTVTGLNLNQNYTLRLRALCSNGAEGAVSETGFVTAATTYNGSIYQHGAWWDIFKVYVDAVEIHSTNLNEGEYDFYNVLATGTHTIKVTYGNAIPSAVKLTVDGVVYWGTVGAVETVWTGINITNGFRIDVY